MAFWNISATSVVKFGGRALLGTLVFNLREGIVKKEKKWKWSSYIIIIARSLPSKTCLQEYGAFK